MRALLLVALLVPGMGRAQDFDPGILRAPSPVVLSLPLTNSPGACVPSGTNLATKGNGTITVTRASTATFVNGAGVLVTCPANSLRVGPSGAIREASGATNLLLRSEEIDNAAWTKVQFSATANTHVAPDGTTTADQILETTNAASHQLSQNVAVSAGACTLSRYVKPIGRQWVRLMLYDGTSFKSAWFDVINGVTGSKDAGVTSTIAAAPSGFYRCSLSYTCAAGAGIIYLNSALVDGGTDAYAGDTTKGYVTWGAQLEAGPVATSYIATTGTSASRSAETATFTAPSAATWRVWTDDGVSDSGAVTGGATVGLPDGYTKDAVLCRNNSARCRP